ncbi:hypothetical protein D2V93_08480 [Flagellimonas taeanensis]|uniref:hypothetical protein n=1 Tax=Flagellimonas taeanensis TaxID=1005926 RepID=UPI000E67B393|nr:hypothetical protein [Allomuricauda taeanensis]RIV50897.1 hypothetical protein D2V93_08480 [Allomuricauda taeanensis]
MENIRLAEFDIDIDAVVKSAAELKKAIDQITDAQKKARKEGNDLDEQYVANEASLNRLRKEYNKHIKSLADSAKATADQANREELLNLALTQEATTIEGLREQNKLLNTLRNQANLTTAEGREEIDKLNAALDRNNDIIKENVDALSQQKINVGNYSDSIRDALGDMNPFNQSITVFISNVQEAGGASAFFSKGMASLRTSILGVTKASLAFIATPIGAILAAIGIAVGLVVNAMNRSEESTNKLNKVFSVFSGISNAVLKALEPLGEFLIDGIVWAMEQAVEAASKARNALADFLDFVGWESAAEDVREFDRAINAAIEGAERLAQAEADLEKAQRQARLTQLEYQKEAEKLRQIRDNENLTIRERIKANEELGAVLEAQQQEELRLAQIALEVANLRIEQEGRTKEALDAQYEALTQIADIEERIEGQRSEQLTNRVTLQKEAADKAIQQQKDALDLFLAEAGERARTLQEELDLEEAASEKRKEILKAELNAKKLSQDAYKAELIRIDEDLARRRAEIAADNAMREIEANRRALELQREDRLFLTQQLADDRKAENTQILEEQLRLAEQRLQQGLINEQEYQDSIRELTEANRLANREIDKEREAIERQEAIEQRNIEFQEELARLQEEGASKFEIERERIRQEFEIQKSELDKQKADGLISEQLYQAKLNAIKQDSRRKDSDNEKALAEQKIAITASVLGTISGLLGKESAAGKAVALAQSLINTYQGITAGLAAPWPMSIPAVATAAATGFKAVKDIIKTNPLDGTGSTASASSVSSDMRRATQPSGINAGQIAASGNAVVQQQIQNSAQQNGLSDVVGAAVREGAAQGTAQGSEQGLTNLSDNKAIMQASTF